MTRYFDMTNVHGCIGFIPENGEKIVLTGVSISAMPLSVKRKEAQAYEQFAQAYGIRFLFEDDTPNVPFYSVPRLDIAAVDDSGGFIASVVEPFCLDESVPLVYISKECRCYLITDDSTKLLSIAHCWRDQLQPYAEVQLFPTKDDARMVYNIEDVEKIPEFQRLMKLMEEHKKPGR